MGASIDDGSPARTRVTSLNTMDSIAGVLSRIPLFKLYRATGWPQMLPLNLTLSPSPKCNSRCLTCNIWMKREDELTLEEWDRVLASLGNAPYWFTISGGEPLMYPHIVELAQLVYCHCRPGVILKARTPIKKTGVTYRKLR